MIVELKEQIVGFKQEGRRVRAELVLRKCMGSDKQEKEIEELQKDVKKLKEENKGLVQQIHNGLNAQVEVEEENEELKKELILLRGGEEEASNEDICKEIVKTIVEGVVGP